jgi:hypothetical protein
LEEVEIYLKETGWEKVNWVHLAQYRNQWQDLVNTG